jgi:hypothetical protein
MLITDGGMLALLFAMQYTTCYQLYERLKRTNDY